MENIEVMRRTDATHESTKRKAGIGGAAIESFAGVGAVVLSIIGLSGRLTLPLAAIAVISAGAALLFEAGAVAADEADAYTFEGQKEKAAVRGAIGADTVAGLGAIALGILALVGVAPVTLLPVAAIVLGAGLLLAGGAPAAEYETPVGGRSEITRNARRAASGVHALVGAGAAILGILGVIGNAPIMLTLIATLSVGAAQLLTGASLGVPMTRRFRHGT